mgnify:CR=1 FL=1
MGEKEGHLVARFGDYTGLTDQQINMIQNSVHIFHIYQQYDHLFSKTVKSLKKDAKDLGVSGFGNKHQLAWRIAKTSQFKDVFGWSGGKCPNRDCRGSLKLDI